MELRHIRYFLAVAQEGNFTRAASGLGIGQPPLSLQIKDLEEEVGALLFRRVPHGAELTAAGQAFMDAVQSVPGVAQRAIKAAQKAARGETGIIRAGFTATSTFNAVVPATIRAFRRSYPDADLNLEEANTAHLIAGLRDGALDVVFLRPDAAMEEEFRLITLSEEPMVAALPARHRSAGKGELDLGQLADEPFVLFPRAIGPPLYDVIIQACRGVGFEPTIRQLAPQISSVVSFVAAELGVSLVPVSVTQLKIGDVVFRHLKGRAVTTKLALAARRTETSKLVQNFMKSAKAI